MTNKKVDLRNPIFHDDNASRRHLEKLLWPLGPHCARCGVTGDPDYEVTGEKYALWRFKTRQIIYSNTWKNTQIEQNA
jgi:hypothetical protein